MGGENGGIESRPLKKKKEEEEKERGKRKEEQWNMEHSGTLLATALQYTAGKKVP